MKWSLLENNLYDGAHSGWKGWFGPPEHGLSAVPWGRLDQLLPGRPHRDCSPTSPHESHSPCGKTRARLHHHDAAGGFEEYIWGTKVSLYLDNGAPFKALIQIELCLSNSSALTIYMPGLLILS